MPLTEYSVNEFTINFFNSVNILLYSNLKKYF